jgi:hypothetical protein
MATHALEYPQYQAGAKKMSKQVKTGFVIPQQEAHESLKQKDRVYYTGDVCNQPAWCQVLTVKQAGGRVYYDLYRIEERDVICGVFDNHIGREYFGHCNPRFVTGEAYDDYRQKLIAGE